MHNYGFDEPSGNFQENNYGNGGAASDNVNAEAQDGGGNCNANFFTPVDGSNPRMQMYTCTMANPARDGDLDNAVIVHEYAHGISNRLTGGPNNVSCLFNAEQPGEGWSDWYGLMLTIEPGDAGTDSRGIGTYLFGQPANGPGIRPAPYSTNFAVNNYTYGDIGSLAIPHGVGFVFATMAWEMTWELIADHGFNPDIYQDWTTGGNNLAMQLVTDGMKLQPCSPGFVNARNGILSADMALTGGANQCSIWEAFARRGLGFSASQGSSGSTTDGTEAFDLPASCTGGGAPIHVGDLDGAGAPAPRNRWNATVTVTVHDEDENPVANASVSGTWSNGTTGSGSCTTNANGQCSVTKTNLLLTVPSVDFTVDNVTLAGSTYEPGSNHDPDGDSNGTTITVFQAGAPGDTHHVGDLDGSSVPGDPGRWTATVTATVHDQDNNPVSGAVVSGAWSAGASGSGTCTTDASGQCSMSKSVRTTSGSVTFTVSNVTLAGSTYTPASNHDPDGDSTGTVITIPQ
jgi:protocatechuate 3,4-dioxygenase beta subunit